MAFLAAFLSFMKNRAEGRQRRGIQKKDLSLCLLRDVTVRVSTNALPHDVSHRRGPVPPVTAKHELMLLLTLTFAPVG